MKKFILPFILCATLLSCKDNPVSKKVKEATRTVSNTTNAVKEITKLQDDMEKLSETTPLTNDELKAWLPDNINGMKRISYKAGAAGIMNIASIEATFANDDKSKKFSINLIDGAGPTGASMTAGMRMMMTQDFEEEDEYSTRKTVTHKDKKAIEEYTKNSNKSNIQFIQNHRFYIDAKGIDMNIDETWNAIEKLNLDNLD